MININKDEILETIDMIDTQHLDVRTITMGISLFDCVSDDENRLCQKIYDKICLKARDLVKVGDSISKEYGAEGRNRGICISLRQR